MSPEGFFFKSLHAVYLAEVATFMGPATACTAEGDKTGHMSSAGRSAHILSGMQATMEVHWGKHHRTYVDNLNKQIEGKPLADKSLEEVIHRPY